MIRFKTGGRIPSFVYVDCGPNFTVVVTNHGQVFGSGDNTHRQLGQKDVQMVTAFTMIENFRCDIAKVACGVAHTLFLSENNIVYACGDNTEGNLGQRHANFVPEVLPLRVKGLRDMTIIDIKAGRHSAALSANG